MATLGGPVEAFTVALRVAGDDLDPDEISSLLCTLPTESWRKGEHVQQLGRTVIAIEGRWTLRSQLPGTTDPEEQLTLLLTRMTDEPTVWSRLKVRYDIDLFCGVFLSSANQGIELSAELLRRLGERGISIGFDIYSHHFPQFGDDIDHV